MPQFEISININFNINFTLKTYYIIYNIKKFLPFFFILYKIYTTIILKFLLNINLTIINVILSKKINFILSVIRFFLLLKQFNKFIIKHYVKLYYYKGILGPQASHTIKFV